MVLQNSGSFLNKMCMFPFLHYNLHYSFTLQSFALQFPMSSKTERQPLSLRPFCLFLYLKNTFVLLTQSITGLMEKMVVITVKEHVFHYVC